MDPLNFYIFLTSLTNSFISINTLILFNSYFHSYMLNLTIFSLNSLAITLLQCLVVSLKFSLIQYDVFSCYILIFYN